TVSCWRARDTKAISSSATIGLNSTIARLLAVGFTRTGLLVLCCELAPDDLRAMNALLSQHDVPAVEPIDLAQLQAIVGGRVVPGDGLPGGFQPVRLDRVAIDSRQVRPGDIFWAL